MATDAVAWRACEGGVEVRVRAQPRARRAGIDGVREAADGPRLRIAVTPPPEDGRANAAVIEALARALGMAPSAVTLVAGATAREKTLRVAGDPASLLAALEKLA